MDFTDQRCELNDSLGSGEEPEKDRLRAAARLVDNHEAIVKFAARGCGQVLPNQIRLGLHVPSSLPFIY